MIDGFSSFSFKYKIHISDISNKVRNEHDKHQNVAIFLAISSHSQRCLFSENPLRFKSTLIIHSKLFNPAFQLDTEVFLFIDGNSKLPNLQDIYSRLSETKSGALTILDVSKLDDDMILNLSGWGSLFWINVQEVNMSEKGN